MNAADESRYGVPRVPFDWRVYADATFAGLTPLIPVPLVDLVFERVFRQRMAGAISRARSRSLTPQGRERLGRSHQPWSAQSGCFALPMTLATYVIKKLWRKLAYFLAVADAATQLSLYWHRAYLLDHLIRAGHADPTADVERAGATLERVLRESDTASLMGLARQLIGGGRRWLRLLVRARREGSASMHGRLEEFVAGHWEILEESLRPVAHRYNQVYVGRPGAAVEAEGGSTGDEA